MVDEKTTEASDNESEQPQAETVVTETSTPEAAAPAEVAEQAQPAAATEVAATPAQEEEAVVMPAPDAQAPGTTETGEKVAGRSWFVAHVQSGWEDKVRNNLHLKIKLEKAESKIFQVFIPTEDVVEVKKNKKTVKKRKFFPGYILLDMIIDNETYWLVKNISGVTGFLGEPTPRALPEEEIRGILSLTEESAEGRPKPAVQFEKGENVRITEGPFRHFIGIVEDVNEPKAKLKAMVTIFGRPTPVELDFLQVEKL